MSPHKQYGPLQINEDIGFERQVWRAQRIGLVLIGLIMLAGLAGVFGRGVLSWTTAGGESKGMRVEYNRFMRHTAAEHMEVIVLDGARSDGELHLWFDAGHGANVRFDEVNPPPHRSIISDTGVTTHVFLLDPRATQPRITVRMRPECVGRLPLRVGLAGRPPIEFTTFVYP